MVAAKTPGAEIDAAESEALWFDLGAGLSLSAMILFFAAFATAQIAGWM